MPGGSAKKNLASSLLAITACFALWPLAVSAASTVSSACCFCYAGDFTAPYCFKTSQPCHELENHASFPNLDAFQCTNNINEAQCRKVADGGICNEVADANTYMPPSSVTGLMPTGTPAVTPQLQTTIPKLTLATDLTPRDGYIQLPFIGQYISGFYRWASGIVLVVAALMIVYGGFLYILGSSLQSVSRGKSVITDAIIGLVIFLSSVLLLNLVNPRAGSLSTLGVRVAGRNDSYNNPLAEKARVEEAATAKPQPIEVVMQDVPEETTTPTTTQQAPEQPQAQGEPAPPPPPTPGKVVKDAYGNNVAQGDCPSDMRAIPYSADYEQKTKKKVESFCMDVYEAPNQKGVMPIRGAHEWEAEWWCQERGKRLCSYSEWVRACLGPKGTNEYGYGPKFIEGQIKDAGKTQDFQGQTLNKGVTVKTGNPPAPCNYDTNTPLGWKGYENIIQRFSGIYKTNRDKERSILNPNNPVLNDADAQVPKCNPNTTKLGCTYKEAFAKYMSEINKFNGAEPSGSRNGCVTVEGIFDMTGNVSEMTVKDKSANMAIDQRVNLPSDPKVYTWAGYNWSPIPHLATINGRPTCNYTSGGGHGAGDAWRDYINGFRCCMGLQE